MSKVIEWRAQRNFSNQWRQYSLIFGRSSRVATSSFFVDVQMLLGVSFRVRWIHHQTSCPARLAANEEEGVTIEHLLSALVPRPHPGRDAFSRFEAPGAA